MVFTIDKYPLYFTTAIMIDAHHRKILARILPVGFALSPVGLLFGILAAQAGWSVVEVLLMSLLGFTGSGQFTYLILAHPEKVYVEYWTVFLIILGINLRYIPMTLSASNRIVGGVVIKGLLSHFLADESYAVERKEYGVAEKAIVRLTIVSFWALTTSVGVLLSGVLPAVVRESLAGLTFPISAILILLAWDNVTAFAGAKGGNIRRHLRANKKLHAIALCACVSVFCIAVIGPVYFWLPGIIASYFLLGKLAETKNG